MKRLITATLFGLCLFLLAGCFGQTEASFPEFTEKTSTAPMKGYQWETVSGAGLKFWAQRDSQNRVVTDALLHGAVVEHRDSLRHTRRQVIRVFQL